MWIMVVYIQTAHVYWAVNRKKPNVNHEMHMIYIAEQSSQVKGFYSEGTTNLKRKTVGNNIVLWLSTQQESLNILSIQDTQ